MGSLYRYATCLGRGRGRYFGIESEIRPRGLSYPWSLCLLCAPSALKTSSILIMTVVGTEENNASTFTPSPLVPRAQGCLYITYTLGVLFYTKTLLQAHKSLKKTLVRHRS